MKKVAIVGVEGSGKTVLMAVMGDKYRSPDENGVFLAPVSRATYAYCAKLAASLRAGKWPFATESGVLNLDWTLMRRQTPGTAPAELGQLSFLDFGGEIYRLAFGDGAAVDLDEQRKQSVELLKGHVRDADALIVLVNLGDIINGSADDERTIEMNWLTQAILTYAFETAGKRNVALVFSQYDTYSETIAQCGGVRGTLSRYLPEVAARYGDRLSLFPIAAVDKTILAPDGSGYPIPAPDFKPLGLEELLQWMCNGVGGEINTLDRESLRNDGPEASNRKEKLKLSIILLLILSGIPALATIAVLTSYLESYFETGHHGHDVAAIICIGFPIVFLPIMGFIRSLRAGFIDKFPKRIGIAFGILVLVNAIVGMLCGDTSEKHMINAFCFTEIICCEGLLRLFFPTRKKGGGFGLIAALTAFVILAGLMWVFINGNHSPTLPQMPSSDVAPNTVSQHQAGDRTVVRIGSQEVALRWCPPGTFMMGSPESEEGRDYNETQHRVTLTRDGDAFNADTQRLTEKAEKVLKPIWIVSATLDGRQVSGAKLSLGKQSYSLSPSIRPLGFVRSGNE